ncbi:MAG TPA: NAD-dependent epimerase/dehydratase family protein [Gemmatimonadaceae bacterium]|nr:NAD-dependent epimerase/dehydratase family protein [Gemmatimonadaceae bacterium]
MKVLVTGGAGFIGSHVVDHLLARGANVTVVDTLVSGRRSNVSAEADFREIDIRAPETATLIREGGFDAICHLAAQIDVRKSIEDPVHDASVNVLGTLNLLEAARSCARPPRFVFSSTGGALYGEFVTPPSDEPTPKDPESAYGVAKLSAEYYMAYFARVHGLDTVALRFGNVYGPRQDPHGEAGVVAIFCNRILGGRPLTIFGDGTQTRDYVYVGDVARAVVAGAGDALPPIGRLDSRAFNIGTGVGSSVLELAESLKRAARSEAVVEHAPKRPGELQASVLDISKARRELRWEPTMSLDAGLAETFAWFAARHSAQPA